MADGYVHIINAFYWRGDDKTMFSPTLEMTTIQDGGAIVCDFSFLWPPFSNFRREENQLEDPRSYLTKC